MIKQSLFSAEKFTFLHFHFIWIIFLLISVTVMFLQKSMFSLVSITVINVDFIFLWRHVFFWREIMTFWNHHWNFSSAVESFFRVWETSLILFADADKLMIFSNDLTIIFLWFLMLRVLNCQVKMMSVDTDWSKRFFKSSLIYAKLWLNFLLSASKSFL